ncbi:hypothetical protein MUK42_15773 [Musa troglodytarum]|uniref:Glycine-rich protein n=2 Tax=Musa troglodytarum TaxID=320322 RepID=A0A9E7HKE4_9LILI|nr:hypothetical protein MUK42_15773 [Musa troglodytarum]
MRTREASMERSSTKMVLVLALFLASFAVGLEARNLEEAEPKAYQPQNIPGGYRGFLGRPTLGGAPLFGLGRPFRGAIPGFGTVPGVPAASGGDRGAPPP